MGRWPPSRSGTLGKCRSGGRQKAETLRKAEVGSGASERLAAFCDSRPGCREGGRQAGKLINGVKMRRLAGDQCALMAAQGEQSTACTVTALSHSALSHSSEEEGKRYPTEAAMPATMWKCTSMCEHEIYDSAPISPSSVAAVDPVRVSGQFVLLLSKSAFRSAQSLALFLGGTCDNSIWPKSFAANCDVKFTPCLWLYRDE